MENVQAVIIFLALLVVIWFLYSLFRPLPTVDYEMMIAELAIADGMTGVSLEQRNLELMDMVLTIAENSTLSKEEALQAYSTIIRHRVL